MLTYERYSQFRDAKGLTDHKVSLLTGIPPSIFSDWGNDRSRPKIETLLKIAKVLKISPRELVSIDDIRSAELVKDKSDE